MTWRLPVLVGLALLLCAQTPPKQGSPAPKEASPAAKETSPPPKEASPPGNWTSPASPRDGIAEEYWNSSRAMKTVAACVVRSLNNKIEDMGLLEPKTTHQVKVIEIGRVVEVVHPRAFFIPTEFYFVRITSELNRSRIELFVMPRWTGKLEDAVAKCI